MDRRKCDRFAVPDASVDWTAEGEVGWGGTGCPLRDLARGGARFLSECPPPRGTFLRLRIRLPGERDPIEARGRVEWSLVSHGRVHHVGIEFAPYGRGPGANDPAVLDRILALEDRFLGAAREALLTQA